MLKLIAAILVILSYGGCTMLQRPDQVFVHAAIHEPVETPPDDAASPWPGVIGLLGTAMDAGVKIVRPGLAALGIGAGIVTHEAFDTLGDGQTRVVRIVSPAKPDSTPSVEATLDESGRLHVRIANQ